jgi:hypothetical protein
MGGLEVYFLGGGARVMGFLQNLSQLACTSKYSILFFESFEEISFYLFL